MSACWIAPLRSQPSHQGVECPGKHQARCARCIQRRDKARAGRGRRPRCQGGGAGRRAASPGAGRPPPGNPEPSPRTGGAGAGRRPGGSRPGGGAGRAGRGGAVLCKCRPRAANCLRSARGSQRPVPPAASRPEQLGNKPQRSREPRPQRRARARLEDRCSPARSPGPSQAARQAKRHPAEPSAALGSLARPAARAPHRGMRPRRAGQGAPAARPGGGGPERP